MSKSVQEIFGRLQEKRQQARIIASKYKSELASSHDYQQLKEQIEKLRERKKKHEASVREQAGANFARMEELKFAIKQDAQLLSDVALTAIMKGESIQIKEDHVEYEPVFTVRFRKTK